MARAVGMERSAPQFDLRERGGGEGGTEGRRPEWVGGKWVREEGGGERASERASERKRGTSEGERSSSWIDKDRLRTYN